jgi:hypothetical protein
VLFSVTGNAEKLPIIGISNKVRIVVYSDQVMHVTTTLIADFTLKGSASTDFLKKQLVLWSGVERSPGFIPSLEEL